MLTKPCPFASHGLSLLQLAFLLQLLSQAKKKGLRERKVKAQDHRKEKKKHLHSTFSAIKLTIYQ
jgi:hypothetical protein